MSEQMGGSTAPSGSLGLVVTRNFGDLRVRQVSLRWKITNWFQNRRRELPALVTYRFLGKLFSLVYIESRLSIRVVHADGAVTDYGVVSRRVVTDVGVAFIVDAFQNIVELEIMKYHGFGTGTTAEAAADTALVTEFTTQYATDNVRPTGSTTEGATANIYRTVATFSPDTGGTLAVTEHGVFSQAATGGGVLLDRSKFAAVNLVAGSDSIQATYELTFTSGS